MRQRPLDIVVKADHFVYASDALFLVASSDAGLDARRIGLPGFAAFEWSYTARCGLGTFLEAGAHVGTLM